jgi:hypothetical protein
MNSKTARGVGARGLGALAAGAAVTVLATACSVNAPTAYPAGPSGSASYRQDLAFVQCVRGHGGPDLPDPRPGGAVTVQTPPTPAPGQTPSATARAVSACLHLLPPGHRHRTLHITIG